MADQLYLSYWLAGGYPLLLLRKFEKMLAAFPYSKLAHHDPSLRIYGVAYSEPPLLETPVPSPVDPAAVTKMCGEFQNLDAAYELSAAWDLWRFDKEWHLAPASVRLTAFGPDFERERDEHLRIDFGIEEQFLPDPDRPDGIAMIRSNIQSLLRLVHDVDEALDAEKRLLWTESGENFAERLQAALKPN